MGGCARTTDGLKKRGGSGFLELPPLPYCRSPTRFPQSGTLKELPESFRMIQLRVRQCELNYEMALSPPVSAVTDAPGELTSALVSRLDRFGLSLSEVTIDDEPSFEDRGLSCEVEKLDACIVLRADRFEVHFLSIEETGDGRDRSGDLGDPCHQFSAHGPQVALSSFRN